MTEQTVVITGAAGGIGQATVRGFIEAGCTVIGLDADPAVHTIEGSTSYHGFEVQLTDDAAVRDIARSVGSVAHLVTIAGGALRAEIGAGLVDPAVWRASLEGNLTSTYVTLHAFHGNLGAGAGNRSVTMTSSINAIQGYGLVAYSAAKAGLSGMMNALLGPLGADGIRINCVLPGTTPTPRTLDEWKDFPEHFAQMAAHVPLRRLADPADIAVAIRALALDLTHASGVELVIDGGQSKGR